MTQRSVTYLKGRFEEGDIPSGTDYADLIDSFVNLEASAEQTMAGKLSLPNLTVTNTVSADIVHATKSILHGYTSAVTIGTTQGSAVVVSADVNFVTVSDAAERGIVLNDHHQGSIQYVTNDDSSVTAATIFPFSGTKFIATAENAGLLLAAGQTIQILHVNASSYAWVRY
jgi:hypothetical protein